MTTRPPSDRRNCLVGALLFFLTVGLGVPLVVCGITCLGWSSRPPAAPLPDPGTLAELDEARPIPDLQRVRREYLTSTARQSVYVRMDTPGIYVLPRVWVGSGWASLSDTDRSNFLRVAFAYFHDGPDHANPSRHVWVFDSRGNELASYSLAEGVKTYGPTSARSSGSRSSP